MFKLIKLSFTAFIIFSVGFLSPAIYADQGGNPSSGQGQGKGQGLGNVQMNVGQPKSFGQQKSNQVKLAGKKQPKNRVRFSNKDKVIIQDQFRAHPFTVSPLPPGIAKNLARGKPLPYGIKKVFLPDGILSSLPVYPGHEYLVAGDDVLLVNSTTGIISDILTNVLR